MRAALVAAGALCLGAIPIAGVHADELPGSKLGSYAMAAAAPGVELKVGEPTYCFTTPAGLNGCAGVVPEVTSQLQNGPIGSATAAIVWPGSLAANLGSLIITAGGSDVPPEATVLNTPVRAEVKTGSNPDTVSYDQLPGTTMKATAKELTTSASASVQSLAASAVGTFGPIKGSTDTSVTGPEQVVSKASSSVSDIDLLAGVVHIDSVSSFAEATSNGAKATVKGKTTVAGATVAGFPVTIDQNGVTVQGTGLALTAATSAVNGALKEAGLTLLVSEPQGKPDGADVTYTSGSLVAQFTQTGYSLGLTMGGANVFVTASPGYDSGSGPVTPVPGVDPPSSGGSTGGIAVPGTTTGGPILPGTDPGTTPPLVDTPGSSPADPVLAAEHAKLGRGGLSPGVVTLALLGTGLMLAGMRRLPDRVLEAIAPVCPLEESA